VKKLTVNRLLKKYTNKKIKIISVILLISGVIILQAGPGLTLSHLLTPPELNRAELPESADISVARLRAAETTEVSMLLTNSKRSWPFLAEVLGVWSETRQLPVPAITTIFSRVILGINILTGLLALIAIFKIVLLIRSVIQGRRYFDPFAVHNTIPRLLNSSGAVLLLLLWWLVGEMLVTNLQPVRYNRLGLAVSLLAVSLLLSALFAPEEN